MKLRFDIGDTIYAVLEGRKEDVCDFCNGTGTVELRRGGEVQCPQCDGTGKVLTEELYKVDVYSFVVGIIQITEDAIIYAEKSESMNPSMCLDKNAYSTEEEARSQIEQ